MPQSSTIPRRFPHLAVIGLGANLGDPIASLQQAIDALRQNPQTADWRVSPFYRSAPVETTTAQPDYINAVALCQTNLEPEAILRWLLETERQFGRSRTPHAARNQPRTLDLDLLLYDQRQMHTSLLTLPHPRLHQRAFVLRPLLDLLPDAALPGLGYLRDYLPQVATQAIERLSDTDAGIARAHLNS